MPAATFAGIHNENKFYSHHYLSEIFAGDLRATVDRWRGAAEAGGGPTPYAALRALAGGSPSDDRALDAASDTASRDERAGATGRPSAQKAKIRTAQ